MEQVLFYKASIEDLRWINQQYDLIGFKHSSLDAEIIIIAKVDGNRAGLGRLVRIDETIAELGGMYVLPQYRGHKLAEKIVRELLAHKNEYQKIFCLPFSHLEGFYKRFGFRELQNDELLQIPEEISNKLEWCGRTYTDKTSLLVK